MDISGAESGPREGDIHGQIEEPAWALVDRDWYKQEYGAFPDSTAPDDTKAFYAAITADKSRSPNPFFNEAWYVANFKDVADQIKAGLIASGFEHYRKIGHSTRSPHWLFSESFYRKCNLDVTQTILESRGFRNGYGHFLGLGDGQKRTGSLYFDPRIYLNSFVQPAESGVLNPFAHFARNLFRNQQHKRLSWYFDPSWYIRTYPAVREALNAGLYSSSLEHYLCNATPQQFDPSAFFSESFYLAHHRDIAGAIAAGRFRNGYEHFTQYGVFERRKPHPEIDLETYFKPVSVQADIETGKFRDVFAHYVAAAEQTKPKPSQPVREDQSKQLSAFHARNIATVLARHPLDFTQTGDPKLSVIMLMQDQIEHSLQALDSLRKAMHAGAIDLILVDTGSYDDTRHIEKFVHGARVIRFEWNAGFTEAANAAINLVATPAILFLSADGMIAGDSVQLAFDRLFSATDIGVVSGKIIQSDGLLAEAGGIIWQDASMSFYLRDENPNSPEANFVRTADFVSAAFMMFKTDQLRAAGGFDATLKAAHFAEADLCIRLAAAGYRTVYDPSVIINKSGGYAAAPSAIVVEHSLIKFQDKHGKFLTAQRRKWADCAAIARHAVKDKRPRILFIEDRLPFRILGAGYTRSNDIIRAMVRLNYHVTVFPVYQAIESMLRIYREFSDHVEVIFERELPDLPKFLAERPGYYDIFWVGRTQNAARVLNILKESDVAVPGSYSVLDTEAVAAMRNHLKDQVRNRPAPAETLASQISAELKHAKKFDAVVAVNRLEAEAISAAGFQNVKMLGHVQTVRPGARLFEQRHGLLFVGALHDRDGPNLDSLNWFVTNVLPKLLLALPDHVRFTIAGYVNHRIDLANIARAKGIDLLGAQEDLAPLYDRHRVFVAPTRFAAGIPYKLHEAAANGIPIVASNLLAQQLGWEPEKDLLTADPADPDRFVTQICRLYSDADLWHGVRDHVLHRLSQDSNIDDYDMQLHNILSPRLQP